MSKKILLLLSVFLGLCLTNGRLQAQSIAAQDSAVRELMAKHIAIGKAKNSMPGYRVQIYYGGDREEANKVKAEFLKQYPDVGAYIIYQQPNFKIRVGDFKTRMLAVHFFNQIQEQFPMSFLVQDNVKLPR